MATFDASDIIGKTLIAKKSVAIKRNPTDASNVVYVAKPSESIGVVFSYLLPSSSRKNLYWMFEDENGRPYYAEHKTGYYDINSLSNQGALTIEEKKEMADAAAESTSDKIFRYAKNGALLAAAVYLAKSFIDKK